MGIQRRIRFIDGSVSPIDPKEIDEALLATLQAHDKGNREVEALAWKLYQRLTLVYDRWRSFHDFEFFSQLVRPEIIFSRHHRVMAKAFKRVADKELIRLMIFMPPGHTKSELTSILLPAWLFGRNSKGRVLHASHTKELVEGFSVQIKDIVRSEEFCRLFTDMTFRKDRDATGRWHTTKGGIYNAVSVGSAVAGKRADMAAIIDDPISEQDAWSETIREGVRKWYPAGFRSRVMPQTPIIIVMTRWHHADLTGHLLTEAGINPKKEQWEVISFPAILDQTAADLLGHGAKAGEALFPELWPLSEMEQIKEEMPPFVWTALYMQTPTDDEGGILKKVWWRPWPKDRPLPEVECIAAFWDTAFEIHEENDFSACTIWGIFWDEMQDRYSAILLDRYNERVNFPTLREDAFELCKHHDCDTVLIEPKASGKSLVQELHRKKLSVREWSPDRGRRYELSKVARAHAASVPLWGGSVYYPEGRRWAEEVIEQCAQFPKGEFDDMVDTCTMAWTWLRRTWWLQIADDTDPEDDEDMHKHEAETKEATYA